MIAKLGISNASSRSINEAVMPMPTGRSVLAGWFKPMELVRVLKKLVDYETKEVEVPVATMGVVQPLDAEQLQMKPEGQRSWKWWMIHATPELDLATDEVVSYNGRKLRIMAKENYEANAFVEYHAVDDYDYKPNS